MVEAHRLSLKQCWQIEGFYALPKEKIDRSTLDHIYKVFIRPKLEYASIVWSDCTEREKLLLERCQNDFARIVSGARRGTDTDKLYEELNWSSLEERRNYNKLVFIHKLFYGQSPEYLSSLLLKQTECRYNLRQRVSIPQMKIRTIRFGDTLIPNAIDKWNELPSSVQSICNLKDFKKAISIKRPCNRLYTLGTRRMQIIHAQLRMGCSILSEHLCNLHVKENPQCIARNEVMQNISSLSVGYTRFRG